MSAWQTRVGMRSLQGLIVEPEEERWGQEEEEEEEVEEFWGNSNQSGGV